MSLGGSLRPPVASGLPWDASGMENPRTIIDIVTAYLPDASEAERAELAAELNAFAGGLFEAFRAGQRFDESLCGMVDSDSPPSGL